MVAVEQIRQLPFHEKIAIVEAIWEDLSAEESAVEVPQWHQELLDERERLLSDGKAHFLDWDEAKKQMNAMRPGSVVDF
jgi:putative addiction module component (TIGR02574 family)